MCLLMRSVGRVVRLCRVFFVRRLVVMGLLLLMRCGVRRRIGLVGVLLIARDVRFVISTIRRRRLFRRLMSLRMWGLRTLLVRRTRRLRVFVMRAWVVIARCRLFVGL